MMSVNKSLFTDTLTWVAKMPNSYKKYEKDLDLPFGPRPRNSLIQACLGMRAT